MLRGSGYSLLTSPQQDENYLLKDKHGLLVRGRGTDHQADALGDLVIPIPFSLPVRLFAEAKNRAKPTGIDAVRNAAGVITDVNQFQPHPRRLKVWRGDSTYHYRYSLFSTSGFTAPAQDFALAHQISLIDLSGPSFATWRSAVETFAAEVQGLAIQAGLTTFPTGQMRAALRAALHSTDDGPAAEDPSTQVLTPMPEGVLEALAQALARSIEGSLVLGFPSGPQVLALKPDDPRRFATWTRDARPVVPMELRYAPGRRQQGEWALLPSHDPWGRSLVLRFATPPALAEWLFALDSDERDRLNRAKQGVLSSITIFVDGRTIRLELDTETRVRKDTGYGEEPLQELQYERRAPDLSVEEPEAPPIEIESPWNPDVAAAYVNLLRQRHDGPWADLLLYAAAHRDHVPRGAVYDIMGFEPQRKMNGITKPFDTACKRMAALGRLPRGVPNPFKARYPQASGWALGLDLDAALGHALRHAMPDDLDDLDL
ncbi:hypothetical protein [Nocardioides sp. NPDC006303]|uniref:hypothetical protein n=1 Tax=Nocardioides sp. NPDC006303 TaxID=3156747 RepID=UPI0033AD9003